MEHLLDRFPVLRDVSSSVPPLSGGEQQMLVIAPRAHVAPRLLMLDETVARPRRR